MKYLVTGRNGQLARSFQRYLERNSLPFSAPDKTELDISNPTLVDQVVSSLRPDVIINCAAYNFVDGAEGERGRAFLVNADGPKYLSLAADKYGSLLVHFSSDYVFDGTKENALYTEEDSAGPLNVYGASKLEGEQILFNEKNNVLVFRLSWVFGDGEQNFIAKLLGWARNNKFLRVSCDEFSVPTYTETVVDVCMRALKSGITGLYHLSSSEYCSRYEWARYVLRRLGKDIFVRPVLMNSFNLPAERPMFSAMSNKAISDALGSDIPDWKHAVDEYLSKMRH